MIRNDMRPFLIRGNTKRKYPFYSVHRWKEGGAVMKKKILFIYNPNAGKGLLKPKLSDIVDIFVKSGCEVVIYPTQSYNDAFKKVMSFDGEYDLVVCSGGDGTLDEVVRGMMKRGEQIPVGYIPTGTTNDFANSLHIPKDLLSAADAAVNGREFHCDIGKFNKNYFVYVAAFGIFTDVSYQTKQEMKNMLGHLAYVLEGAKRVFDIPSYHVKVTFDSETIEDDFIFCSVTNSRSMGGFRNMFGHEVEFDDGEFEVTLVKTPGSFLELQGILAALMRKQRDSEYMYNFKAKHICFESLEEIPWTLDGEFGGEFDRVDIKNEQQALAIMVPEEKAEELIHHPYQRND